jgi:Transposase
MVCCCRLGFCETSGLRSRCSRWRCGRTRIPAQRCRPDGLADWVQSITGEASMVAIAIEVPHGPVVDVLLDRGFIVHSINPKQLDRLRDRFSVAGAKDDRRDAHAAADGLRTDRHLFRRLQVGDPRIIELRESSRLAEELQQERVRLGNRLHHQLWRYYPQMLELTDDVAAGWFLDLWIMAPTPAKGKHLRKASIERLLKSIASVASMPRQSCAACISPSSRWRRASLRRPVYTSAPSSLVSTLSIANYAMLSAGSMNSALRLKAVSRMMWRFSGHCLGSVGSTSPRCWPRLRGLSADAIIRRCGRCPASHQ